MRPLSRLLSTPFSFLPLLLGLLSLSASAFDCEFERDSIKYDLRPLAGYRHASKNTDTPPTTSEARIGMRLCSELEKQDDIPEEDQCPAHTKVCLTLHNHKESASEKDRVTAVVPIWTTETPDDRIWIRPRGQDGKDGVRIVVHGPDYAGSSHYLNLTLTCDQSATDPHPKFISYASGSLVLQWATPDACPRSGGGGIIGGGGGGSGEGGVSLWGLIKSLFWLLLIGLIIYFAVGIFYNHQQYSAKGWDLIPHRDFWRSAPELLQDLFSHLFANVRGGGGGSRGSYSSIG